MGRNILAAAVTMAGLAAWSAAAGAGVKRVPTTDPFAAPDRPTAMLCLSDSIAYGVYLACAELGLEIPADVSVAGFGDHPISRLLDPPLTSTIWDVEHVARLATRFLKVELDDEDPRGPRREIVAPQLVTRSSTGPAPSAPVRADSR